MKFHYIVVDGPIGVGKTTVAERIAERLEASLLREEWSQNPFLRGFYEGTPGTAFQTELFFLLTRFRQQQELRQRDLFTRYTVADYLFEKSRLFAYLNLDDGELLVYEKLWTVFTEQIPKPDLVVYLQAPAEVLIRRVRGRGRPEEERLSEDYLAEVARAYSHYFFHYTQTPLLVVNTAEVDFVRGDDAIDDLLKQMRTMGRGTQYYVPLASR